jgi:lipid II isoglutaminyl synthase (glutamine-hydrolysing)
MVSERRLRIAHLFPDLLRFYGDGGNVATLVKRAEARSIVITVTQVPVGSARIPPADLVFIGGGQDREQVTVARELERLAGQLTDLVTEGAALLAVCGGYQNLGLRYRTSQGVELFCPGLLPISTEGSGDGRLVGAALARVDPDLLGLGRPSEDGRASDDGAPPDPTSRGVVRTVVGFENHAGRTVLQEDARPFATIEIGHGNNDLDDTEGVLLLPGEAGLRGLRIGTYLHGPLLPRNPHIADALIAAAVAHDGEPLTLAALDDRLEWAAHDAAVVRLRRMARADRRIPVWAHRMLDPIKALIGY